MEHRANIEAKDKQGKAALRGASERGHGAVVELLLMRGANIGAKDEHSPTAGNGHVSVVKVLLEHAAPIDTKGDLGQTVLYVTSKKGIQARCEDAIGAQSRSGCQG